MARIRSLKPEYWADEEIAELPRDARLLYVGLWNLADEHARLRGDARYVKGQLFPYDDDLDSTAIDGLLKLLADAGKLVRYVVGGRSYAFLPTLSKHQRLEPDRVPSRLPGPPGATPSTPSSEPRADESAPDANTSEPRAKDHALSMFSSLSLAGSMEQQHARERAPAAAIKIVLETLDDATSEDAEAIVEWVKRERRPRQLVPVLRTIAQAGELPDVLAQVRVERAKADAATALAQARASPPCEHGTEGGTGLHPETGLPLCPICRHMITKSGAGRDPEEKP
jgi:hypothetical protein